MMIIFVALVITSSGSPRTCLGLRRFKELDMSTWIVVKFSQNSDKLATPCSARVPALLLLYLGLVQFDVKLVIITFL